MPWFGHEKRMEGKRLPNAALPDHMRIERSRRRPRKRCMDNVREDLEERGIWKTKNREVWRSIT